MIIYIYKEKKGGELKGNEGFYVCHSFISSPFFRARSTNTVASFTGFCVVVLPLFFRHPRPTSTYITRVKWRDSSLLLLLSYIEEKKVACRRGTRVHWCDDQHNLWVWQIHRRRRRLPVKHASVYTIQPSVIRYEGVVLSNNYIRWWMHICYIYKYTVVVDLNVRA